MPGCRNGCLYHSESYGILQLDADVQIRIEKEVEKLKSGDDFDGKLIARAVARTCLSGYRKEHEDLRINCSHFYRLPDGVSREEILLVQDNKTQMKRYRTMMVVSIVAIVCSSVFSYLSLDTADELKLQLEQCHEMNSNLSNQLMENTASEAQSNEQTGSD